MFLIIVGGIVVLLGILAYVLGGESEVDVPNLDEFEEAPIDLEADDRNQ